MGLEPPSSDAFVSFGATGDLARQEIFVALGAMVGRGAVDERREKPRRDAMNEELTAKADVAIDAPVAKVWDALVNPEVIRRYMMGATVVSDWKEGSPIAWRGEWKGKPYEDRGRLVELRAPRRLRYTHFSPLTGLLDLPENYHTVTVDVTGHDGDVHVTLSQDNNKTRAARDDAQKNWEMMLKGLKNAVEGRA